MKVKELIEQLSKLNPESEVKIDNGIGFVNFDIKTVYEIYKMQADYSDDLIDRFCKNQNLSKDDITIY